MKTTKVGSDFGVKTGFYFVYLKNKHDLPFKYINQMLQLEFSSIQEAIPGKKWKALFDKFWPAYKSWFESKGGFRTVSVDQSLKALKDYMPELIPTFERLCSLAEGYDQNEVQRFLSGYNPPAYISGCSQAIWLEEPQLIRNYDYHPALCEGVQLMTAWNHKKIIATSDCLWGVVDGMNEDGLAVSLTFGGKKDIGDGFGIPFILRYLLEFSRDIQDAIEILQRVPSHMAYNVALLDANGNHKIIQVAPNKSTIVLDDRYSTNHQGIIEWPEHAAFSKTIERANFIDKLINTKGITKQEIANAFLKSPLYNTQFQEGFGTIFTSIYHPKEKKVELRWQDQNLIQSFDHFDEKKLLITYDKLPQYSAVERSMEFEYDETSNQHFDYKKYWDSSKVFDWKRFVQENSPSAVPSELFASETKEIDKAENLKRGEIPWEQIADYWRKYGEMWASKFTS